MVSLKAAETLIHVRVPTHVRGTRFDIRANGRIRSVQLTKSRYRDNVARRKRKLKNARQDREGEGTEGGGGGGGWVL